MKVFRDGEPEAPPRGAVATVGNYDGIHRGQRAVLEHVVERARATAAPALAVTFDPHPMRVVAPERAPLRLTTDTQRERLLAAIGLDALVVLRFTRELAATPAEDFVTDLLVGWLAVREIHVGRRFAFGQGRRGSLALLERMGRALGFAAFGVAEIEDGGGPVSATRIRTALAAGRVEEAAQLLGRPYAVAGTVVHGDRRGRALGFPTLNLASANEILPADGVYVARTALGPGEEEVPGVANVGVRPTIGRDSAPLVETHLLDFERDCYGAAVEVRFLSRLRGERRFASLDELRGQITRDVESAREYFAGAGRSDRMPDAGGSSRDPGDRS